MSIPLVRSMLSGEAVIQAAVNAVGMLGTSELLSTFDTDGSPINVAHLKLTSKGKVQKNYETPYGQVSIDRHVYQTSQGGATYCPLDDSARIVGSATPKLAQVISINTQEVALMRLKMICTTTMAGKYLDPISRLLRIRLVILL